MSVSSVQRFYRYHALVYDHTRWMILHGRRRAVRELNLKPDARLLEIGCGTGLNFRFAQEQLDPRRSRLVGVDFSADMLRVAEARVHDRGWRNVELVNADATTLDLGEQFDGVFFAYSLTMIPDYRAALQRGREHLRPGGRLVVLDFGAFQHWGPLAPVMRAWLRANHVETTRPYLDAAREIFPELRVIHWMGGYNFTAVGERRS